MNNMEIQDEKYLNDLFDGTICFENLDHNKTFDDKASLIFFHQPNNNNDYHDDDLKSYRDNESIPILNNESDINKDETSNNLVINQEIIEDNKFQLVQYKEFKDKAKLSNFGTKNKSTKYQITGLHIKEVKPDGNCWYRCAAIHVFDDETKYEELKKAILEYATEYGPKDSGEFSTWLEIVSSKNAWADFHILEYFSRMSNIPIIIYKYIPQNGKVEE